MSYKELEIRVPNNMHEMIPKDANMIMLDFLIGEEPSKLI